MADDSSGSNPDEPTNPKDIADVVATEGPSDKISVEGRIDTPFWHLSDGPECFLIPTNSVGESSVFIDMRLPEGRNYNYTGFVCERGRKGPYK